MKRVFFFVSTVTTLGCGLAAALVACGGSTEDAAVVAPGGDSGGGSTSSGATSSTSSGGSTTSSGGSTSSSGGAADGGATDGGGNNDGGGASSGTPNQIQCGTATCNATTQKCCTTFSQGQGAVWTCIGATADCQGANQECDDKTDCPAGEICCAGGGGGSFGASCQATCGQGIQICKAANECVDGGACQTYTCFNQQVSLCRKPQFGCQ